MSHSLILKQKANAFGSSFPEFKLFNTETGEEFRHITRCSIELNASQQPIVNISFIADEIDLELNELREQHIRLTPPDIQEYTSKVTLVHGRSPDES